MGLSELTIFALSWAIGFAMIVGVTATFATRNPLRGILNAVVAFVLAFTVNQGYIYLCTPSFVGTFWGQGHMFLPLILSTAIFLAVRMIQASFHQDSYRRQGNAEKGAIATRQAIPLGIVLVFAIVAPVGTYITASIYYGWGTNNVREWAKLANVRTASHDEKLPDADPGRIQAVTEGMAFYKCHTAITKGGEALSSFYTINKNDMVRQAVGDRTYFVAPLSHASGLYQFMGWAKASPGYCMVDSENPNAEAEMILGHSFKVLPTGYWMENLQRHVYFNGYHRCNLDDPGIEIDDNKKPYATMTCTTPKFVTGGQVMKSVIVVDLNTGKIDEYAPNQVPAWIERVMSDEIVSDYQSHWGMYGHPDVTWLFNGGRNQKKKADMDMVYNSTSRAFWSMPMTSINGGDSAMTGLLMYETRSNSAVYYPGLNGIPVGAAVTSAFDNAKGNIQKYKVRSVQLYPINGQVTYVGIYVQDQGDRGETFAGIGFLHAKHVSVNNVIFAGSMGEALARYSIWLGNMGGADVDISKSGILTKPVTGTIFRIGKMLQSGVETYVFMLNGDARFYTISPDGYAKLPLVQPGDRVEFSFIDTDQPTVAVAGFKNLTIEESTGTKN